MKKLIAIFILLAGGGGAAWWYYNYGKPKEKPQVLTAAVSRQDIVEVVQATGSLEANRTVQVGAQVSGTVQDLFVDFNYIVKKDQIIAKIDPTLLEQQVMLQQASLDRQQGDIDQQNVQLENDKLNLSRQQALFDKDMIPKSTLEAAQLQVKSRMASIESAKKSMLQTKAQLQQAMLNVDYCTIKSPVDGVIVNRIVDKGQAVSANQNIAQFFTIATDLTSLKLTAGVDEADIGKVRKGMPVEFTVESYGQQKFSGTVDAVRLNATTTNNVVTYPVWITVPNRDLKLRPSMTANAKIIISTAEGALRIPNAATRFKPNSEVYTALGLTPPAAGQGRGGRPQDAANQEGRPGGQGANATANGQPATGQPAAPDASAAPNAPQQDARANQNPQGANNQQAFNRQGQGTGGRGGNNGGRGGFGGGNGQGFGGNTNRQRGFGNGAANMTQDQIARMQAGRTGGRGGGQGGRGGRNGVASNTGGDTTPLTERNANQIDELFQEPPRQMMPATVYTWDEAKKELKAIRITTGVSDGTFSELVSGDVTQGMQLVTSVLLPQPKTTPGGTNSNIFGGGGPQRGMGGMTPGGGGPGGGGGGRGGGGGGRGGGN